MNLKALDLEAVPSASRTRYTRLSPEELAEAIETLKEGKAVSSDQTFKNDSSARRAGLVVRGQINEEDVEFADGLGPSTSVWHTDDETYYFAVVLRPLDEKKEDQEKE